MAGKTPPCGGKSKASEGLGIFVNPEDEEAIPIWVDGDLRFRRAILQQLEGEGGRIATDHTKDDTALIVLSPASEHIFDMYCHPEWLLPDERARICRRRQRDGVTGVWTWKILLKEGWVNKCVAAGRFLGEPDAWGGCRAGGPPPGVLRPQTTNTPLHDAALSAPHTPTKVTDQVSPAEDDQEEGIETVEAADDQTRVQAVPESNPTQQKGAMPKGSQSSASPTLGEGQASKLADTARASSSERLEPEAPSNDPDAITTVQNTRRIPAPFPLPEPESKELGTNQTYQTPQGAAVLASAERAVPSPSPKSLTVSNLMSPAEAPERVTPEANESLARTTEPSPTPLTVAADPQQPPTLETTSHFFSGLRFWVDLTRPGRKHLIKGIKHAGGEICVDYALATHVLIHDYRPFKWDPIIRDVVQQGVWFMTVQWAIQCLEQKARLPELGLHLPGGAPILLGMEDSSERADHHPGSSRSGGAKVSPSMNRLQKLERESPNASRISNRGDNGASGYDKHGRLASSQGAFEERMLNGEGSATPVNKKTKRNQYTEEEEREMAAYIRGRLPAETSTTARDWDEFAVNHQFRTRSAYIEHYRIYKGRIDQFVRDAIGSKGADEVKVDQETREHSNDSIRWMPDVMNGEGVVGMDREVIELGSD